MGNSRPTLSIAPYFGGKARMAHFIADRLDYDTTDTFISPFGGMCRVLLNKPPHEFEFYNDYDAGLVALISVLSDPETAKELIFRLSETEYSQEEFDRRKRTYDQANDDPVATQEKWLRKQIIDSGIADSRDARKFLNQLIRMKTKEEREKRLRLAGADQSFIEEIIDSIQNHREAKRIKGELKAEGKVLASTRDSGLDSSDMDLAIATYVVYQQSRDGMGKSWSGQKFQTEEQYKAQIAKLFDCAERLAGVQVFELDAAVFYRRLMFLDVEPYEDEGKDNTLIWMRKKLDVWINNPRVMMYCDPSYISVEKEEEALEGIDIASIEIGKGCPVTDAIKKERGQLPKNLGKTYTRSFDYEKQEIFLRFIRHAKCKILVSNYDLQLYNKYLDESAGWHREEFSTTTGVGGKRNNQRIEVIWYNY